VGADGDFIRQLFSGDGFMPQALCYLWRPDVPVALHVVSDSLITLSYFSIPYAGLLCAQRKDFGIPLDVLVFRGFLSWPAHTHLLEIWVVSLRAYG